MGTKAKRSCIACRTEKFKDELLRFVAVDNKVVFDLKQKLNTRGCYLCFSKECFKKSTKKDLFKKALKNDNLEYISFISLAKLVRDTYKRYLYTLLRVNVVSKNVVEGVFNVKDALKNDKAFLVLFPSDVSNHSKAKLTNLIVRKKIPFYHLESKSIVAQNIHRPIRGAYAVLNKQLAAVIIDTLEKMKEVKKWI